jgi:nucleoside-diphosphate-sugar epimerase
MALIDELHAHGKGVRAVNRQGTADVPDGVEVVGGDATDEEFARVASANAGVVYFCLNPPYTKWPELFPPMQAAVLAGAASAGAKLVALENLYMYGPTGGAPLTEDLPYAATGRKGATRARMAQDLLDAHRAGKVRVAIGRPSDYFGPRGLLSAMGERVFYPALAGKKTQVMGNPDQPHTYSYIPDIAKGLAILGERDEADGEAWHLPNAPALTTRQFIEQVYAAAGTEAVIQAMPRLMVNVVGLFNGNVRELKEMLYEFEEPYVVDHSRFEAAFGNHATPLPEAIETTVAWYRANPRGAG